MLLGVERKPRVGQPLLLVKRRWSAGSAARVQGEIDNVAQSCLLRFELSQR
jgi:hypothetical protein